MTEKKDKVLLQVDSLCVDYITEVGAVRAVDDVNFVIKKGEIFGLAGESGCGKSTIAFSLMNLHRPPAIISNGNISINNIDVLELSEDSLNKFRWDKVSMVFQSAMNCLNPVKSIQSQFLDIFKAHNTFKTKEEGIERAKELLGLVDISPDRLNSYPHQFSGGMRQRVVIALSLALNPDLLIMDEPTTALDVVVQKEILQKVYELQLKYGFSILFITHDLSLMVEFCDRIGIMYAGQLVEVSNSKDIIDNPSHPYTKGLVGSFPTLQGEKQELLGIPGNPPNLANIIKGCRFKDRCYKKSDVCDNDNVPLINNDDKLVRCHNQLR